MHDGRAGAGNVRSNQQLPYSGSYGETVKHVKHAIGEYGENGVPRKASSGQQGSLRLSDEI